MARASGAGHGDDRGHLPKARAGSRGGGGICPRESLTHPPPLSRGPPGSLTSSPSPYFLADVGACLPVQLTGSHGKAIARLAIDRLLLPPRAFGRLSPRSSTSGATGSLPPPHSSHEVFHLERLCLSFFVYQVNCTESRPGACKCNVSHRKHEPKRVWGGGYHKGFSTLPLTIEITRKLKKEKNGDEKKRTSPSEISHLTTGFLLSENFVSPAQRDSRPRDRFTGIVKCGEHQPSARQATDAIPAENGGDGDGEGGRPKG